MRIGLGGGIICAMLPRAEVFLDHRSEFSELFVDVEDEIAALAESLEPGFEAATPAPDVVGNLRRCFAGADYTQGPVRPISLIRTICSDPAIETTLRDAGASVSDLMVELGALEDESVILFRGWLPQLFRQHWNRQRWTKELAMMLAHASIEASRRHSSSFSSTDILLSVWPVEPIIREALERSGVTRIKLEVMTLVPA